MTPVIDADGPTGNNLATTAETVVATVGPINTRPGGSQVIVQGTVTFTTGASTTGVALRVRRGTTTGGAQVGQTQNELANASAPFEGTIQVQDNPGEVAGQFYAITAQQVAATGNSTNFTANARAEF